jgi:hypothetical protein
MTMRLLPLLLALALQQGPSAQQIKETLEAITRTLDALIQQIPSTPPILTAADLQKALDAGGTIELPKGQSYAGVFVIAKSGTVLIGNGAMLTGTGGPALTVKPGTVDVDASDLNAVSDWTGAVMQCGSNDASQTTLARQPKRITFRNIAIPTHRGKRGIEFNCGGSIFSSSIADVWSSALADSQAIWIGNTCGPVTIQGGTYIAASENIMIGGDLLKITDCPEGVVTDILIEAALSKPEYWRLDGVKRAVKNLLEIKAGKRITVQNSTLSGSWGPAFGGAQDGSAIVITPKNGQYIGDVTIDRVTVDRAAGGLQLMGKDYNSVTPIATTAVTVRNSTFLGLTKAWGGRGILALVVGGMQAATFENVDFTGDGNAIVICDTQTPVGPLVFRGSRMTTGLYGVMAPGVNYGGPAPAGYEARACVVEASENSFADAPSRFKTNFPSNTWITSAELDAILAR